MNREQRRALVKAGRDNPDAIFCPKCGRKQLHVGEPRNYLNTEKGCVYLVKCAVCGAINGSGHNGENGIDGENIVKGRYFK